MQQENSEKAELIKKVICEKGKWKIIRTNREGKINFQFFVTDNMIYMEAKDQMGALQLYEAITDYLVVGNWECVALKKK